MKRLIAYYLMIGGLLVASSILEEAPWGSTEISAAEWVALMLIPLSIGTYGTVFALGEAKRAKSTQSRTLIGVRGALAAIATASLMGIFAVLGLAVAMYAASEFDDSLAVFLLAIPVYLVIALLPAHWGMKWLSRGMFCPTQPTPDQPTKD